MSKKQNRAGPKFGGRHTTFIPTAARLADVAVKCEEVTKVVPGVINSGLRSASGQKRVKITEYSKRLVLGVRENANHQEIGIRTENPVRCREILVHFAEEEDIEVK
jgi:hypothetical protein